MFTIKRKYREGEATLGTLFDEDGKQICKTLELPWLDNKEGISCIPEGLYEVEADDTGRHRYWKILNVPEREAVEFHIGNKVKHTRGCICAGKEWVFMNDELAINSSKLTLDNLKDKKILPDSFELDIRS